MTEKIQFRREGEPAFPSAEEKETSLPEGEQTEVVTDPSQEGEGKNTPVAKHIPFDQDPEVQGYIDRQVSKKLEAVEAKHLESIEAIRKEFGGQRQDNADKSKIPTWFGGSQEQWDEYRADLDQQLVAAEERAINRITSESSKKTETENKAVQEATDYMKSELAAITADKTLNPSGKAFDDARSKELLQIVLDNELIDTKGRWNYRAGMKILNATQKPAVPTEGNRNRRALAAATVSGGGSSGDDKPKNYKTSEDFKRNRPW